MSTAPENGVRISGCLGYAAANEAWDEIAQLYTRLRLPFTVARLRYGRGWALYRMPREEHAQR